LVNSDSIAAFFVGSVERQLLLCSTVGLALDVAWVKIAFGTLFLLFSSAA